MFAHVLLGQVIIFLFCAIMFVATVTMGLPYWPAQTICGCSLALFISLFTIFISRYLLLYSPPNRYGAVQGVYTFVRGPGKASQAIRAS